MDWLTDIPALLSSHSAPGQLAHRLTKARLDLSQRKDRRAEIQITAIPIHSAKEKICGIRIPIHSR